MEALTTHVHYAEAKGDDGLKALRRFLNVLPPLKGFISAELMWCEAQPGLYLVMSRWEGKIPPLEVAEGVKAWDFEVVDNR